jgi:hypothetical protein
MDLFSDVRVVGSVFALLLSVVVWLRRRSRRKRRSALQAQALAVTAASIVSGPFAAKRDDGLMCECTQVAVSEQRPLADQLSLASSPPRPRIEGQLWTPLRAMGSSFVSLRAPLLQNRRSFSRRVAGRGSWHRARRLDGFRAEQEEVGGEFAFNAVPCVKGTRCCPRLATLKRSNLCPLWLRCSTGVGTLSARPRAVLDVVTDMALKKVRWCHALFLFDVAA